jgi:hypothetical protein
MTSDIKLTRIYPALLVMVFFFSITTLSCNDSSGPDGQERDTISISGQQPTTGLFIQNFYMDRAQFLKLDTAIGNPNDLQKFVFEFYFNNNTLSGSPTLLVKEAKMNNKGYGSDSVTLKNAAGNVNSAASVYFSTLQFLIRPIKNAFHQHQSDANCAMYFVGQSDPHPYYKIYVVPDYTTILNKQLDSSAISLLEYLGNANPSPPHPSN